MYRELRMNVMASSIVTLIVVGITARLLLKRYQPHFVLFAAGLTLMAASVLLGADPAKLVAKKAATGLMFFDFFKSIEVTMSSRAANLGLIIMSAGGFAKYMDVIGASGIMVTTITEPLKRLRAPYLMLFVCFLVGTFLKLFIPSASGLSVLLMVTIFPIVVRLGVSIFAAAAMVVTCGSFHLGPASGSLVMGAEFAGMTPVHYFLTYQIPSAIPGVLVLGIVSYFVQKYYDKKQAIGAHFGQAQEVDATLREKEEANLKNVPRFYIFLPTLPLLMLLMFSEIGFKGVKISVTLAMLVSFAIAILCEVIRRPGEVKQSLKEAMSYFDGMGRQFALVVMLIVAAETFAKGLIMSGSINALIELAQNAGLGRTGMVIAGTMAVASACLVMGSGNATFFSFVALAPDIAKTVGFPAVDLIMPVHYATSIIVNMTPIAAIVVVVSGMANISPFDVIKRTALPSVCAFVTVLISSIIVCQTITP